MKDLPPVKEYIQPDLQEWIPVARKAQILDTMLVWSPTKQDKQACGESEDRFTTMCWNTVLNCSGNSVETFIGPELPDLGERVSLYHALKAKLSISFPTIL